MPKLLIFTDLDGTLLARNTYSWEEARSTLNLLFTLNIPVIFCSSKTRQESTYYRGQMGIKHPFVVENGAAIYSPLGYFAQPISGVQQAGYEVLEMGVPYTIIRNFIQQCRSELGVLLWGFGDLSSELIQEVSGLPLHLAELAQHRQYDEPFYFAEEQNEKRLSEIEALAARQNLTITRSGLFYHLSGQHDKGTAAKTLLNFYQENDPGEWLSIGLGDSLNDLSLLQAVDIPCLLPQTQRKFEQRIVDRLSPRLAGEPAPQGWVQLILQILTEYKLV